jgi:hypothetical protein
MPAPLASVLVTLVTLATLATTGCGGSSPRRASAPAVPTEQAKCRIAAGQENPLVTEWPASEKANLESRLRAGGVAVEYSGCSMRLLPQCPVKGEYAWKRTTIATDTLEIRDADELYAKLPLGAVSLESELQRSGRIAVQTTVSGQRELRGFNPAELAKAGECADATHVIRALSVGTFKMRSGGALSVRGGASLPGLADAGGATSSEESVMREAGDPEACKAATDEAPTLECASPIQVFLWPLPGSAPERGPPGTVKVSFYSADASRSWQVLNGPGVLCTTPCSTFVDPAVSFAMRSEASPVKGGPAFLEVPDLRVQGGGGPVEVRAHARSLMGFAGGVVMTTFGGVGVAAGAVLLPLGLATKDDDLTVAGAITLPLSTAILFVPGIWLIVQSAPSADVIGPGGRGTSGDARRAPRALRRDLALGGTF